MISVSATTARSWTVRHLPANHLCLTSHTASVSSKVMTAYPIPLGGPGKHAPAASSELSGTRGGLRRGGGAVVPTARPLDAATNPPAAAPPGQKPAHPRDHPAAPPLPPR